MRQRFQQFMMGRYGTDQLNQCINILVLVLLILEFITRNRILWFLSIALLIYSYYRFFSKDHRKRYAENMKFLGLKDSLMARFSRQKYYAEQRKDFHIYTCPTCKQKIRIPKGKGRINVTCPKCRTSFIKKS